MRTPLYVGIAIALIAFGILGLVSIGAPLLLTGVVMLVAFPWRRRPDVLWPALAAPLAFTLVYALLAPLSCRSSSVGPLLPRTECSNVLGIDYSGTGTYDPPLLPAFLAGLAAAAVARSPASLARAVGGSSLDGAGPRPATPDDSDELARLRWDFRVEAGTPATRSYETFVKEFRAFAKDVFADGGAPWRAWVAEDDDRLVGCAWIQLVEKVPHPNRERWERPIAYLTNMYVEPAYRNSGLGRELLNQALGFAREREVDGVLLWPSERSRPFYERAGFGPGFLWFDVAGD